ncbi:aminotransferase class I/II-fold pyridoxal phosphate-dependent enzyme [Chryseobacterium oryctis]|uniref:Pyridoxal phosphate-dependent aminotransferase family protein n=1 Tax=Chryseobacterium oryctis TaxID=2952618 RepID=A0ABT3HSJ3_9FLAO|nr:pyridoxal phosphate-dependent aminotransferase family protein [Chryseobacterium oryctis]MCW3162752.1 pyridoxal phosphate-dependent aminotransferase family protein [Chryseobacterium oryctis]
MHNLSHFQKALEKRKNEGTCRELKPKSDGIDFYSNDYLGFARNKDLQNLLLKNVLDKPHLLSGSTGSRLISGNSSKVTSIENFIAKEHQYPSALLFSSGYNANLALFSSLLTRHDSVIVDEYIHRSVHDACKMSDAKKLKFKHNDIGSLEQVLKRQNKQVYIAIESLYSMEGDFAPIQEIVEISEKYQANLIVDEAHAFGVLGYGLIDKLGFQNKVLATVVTYGKALGSHGAVILCNDLIKSYLVNFASPFIYTTSAQNFQWMSIKNGYDFLKSSPEISKQLQKNIEIFNKQELKTFSSVNSPIKSVLISDNQKLKALQDCLFENGFLTYAVYSPTVKQGAERLRICLHSFNTEEEIVELCGTIREFI